MEMWTDLSRKFGTISAVVLYKCTHTHTHTHTASAQQRSHNIRENNIIQMIPPNTPWAAPKYFESFIKASAFCKIKVYRAGMFCLCFLVGMLQPISTEHPWTRVMFLVIRSSRESGSQPSTLMKTIPEGWAWRGPLQPIASFLLWKSTVTVLTRHAHSGRDSNDTRHVSLLCFYPQCLIFRSSSPSWLPQLSLWI